MGVKLWTQRGSYFYSQSSLDFMYIKISYWNYFWHCHHSWYRSNRKKPPGSAVSVAFHPQCQHPALSPTTCTRSTPPRGEGGHPASHCQCQNSLLQHPLWPCSHCSGLLGAWPSSCSRAASEPTASGILTVLTTGHHGSRSQWTDLFSPSFMCCKL